MKTIQAEIRDLEIRIAAPGMLRMIQMLTFMKRKGLSLDAMVDELNEIVDNGNSQYFDLKDGDISAVGKILHDDAAFERACSAAGVS